VRTQILQNRLNLLLSSVYSLNPAGQSFIKKKSTITLKSVWSLKWHFEEKKTEIMLHV
jgi:hypothetical protein